MEQALCHQRMQSKAKIEKAEKIVEKMIFPTSFFGKDMAE